jgi:hypothetical protein
MRSASLLKAAPLVLAAVFTAACSGEQATTPISSDMSSMPGMSADKSLKEGVVYVADLSPLNPEVQNRLDPDRKTSTGVASGKAYFKVVNGMLTAVVDAKGTEPAEGAFPDGIHPQHIHASDRCPTASADTNGDGIVDVIEGLPFYGPILVPLDGDISNATSEIPTFPFGMGKKGTYHYEASTTLSVLEAAIGEPLNLSARHVVIHGVDLATPLPASVQSLPGLPAQITLPIACGEIREAR